jgi:hypothetical protein
MRLEPRVDQTGDSLLGAFGLRIAAPAKPTSGSRPKE